MGDVWFRASLRVSSSVWDPMEIERFLDIPGAQGPGGRVWLVDFLPNLDNAVLEKLDSVAAFLESYGTQFQRLPKHCSIDLFIGWSLLNSQGSLHFPTRLLQLLASVQADILIDSYAE